MTTAPRPKPTSAKPQPTNAQIDSRVHALEHTVEDMHSMMTELYQGLMVPQPGQGSSLLNRMAKVTIDIESGERTSDRAVNMAQKLITLGNLGKTFALWVAVGVAIYTALRLGFTPKGDGQ